MIGRPERGWLSGCHVTWVVRPPVGLTRYHEVRVHGVLNDDGVIRKLFKHRSEELDRNSGTIP